MSFSIRTLFATALSLAAFSQLSCKVNDYCLECSRGDGGNGDGGGTNDAGDGGMGMDGSGSGSGCLESNGGQEICDGKDNDCNGLIDDGALPGVGDDCTNQVGECMGGTQVCVTKFHCSVTTTSSCTGATDTTSCPNTETCVAEDITTDHLGCTKHATPERCDGKDNDCNGMTDEGDPGGGSKCGTDLGECVAGTNHCIAGSVQCQGFIDHRMDPELCDAKDNDCDGNFDEGLTNMGTCGQAGTPPCSLGTLQCMGGAQQCVGAVDPTFEACDNIDNDCNGVVDDGYDKLGNPNTCGTNCTVCGVPANSNANPTCDNGTCSFACKPGYQDKDGVASNGCEFGPCFASGSEVCDGLDNDCDGNVDESLTPPAICLTKGQCAGTVAQCTMGGWVCTYGSGVETDPQGNVVAQETRCDGKDNDCDGATDEGDPLKKNNVACHDNQVGICQTSGHYKCDPNDVDAPPICDNSNPGQTAAPEACDNVDNDCDGNTDEDLTAAGTVGEDWINIGGGHQMAKYEMSKPDASSTDPGSVTAHACSKQGVQPWVNVTYPQAVAACSSIGATLCGETEWHRACSVIDANTYPLAASTTGTLIEAEDYSSVATAATPQAAVAESACNNAVDDDGDGFINDGCPIRSGTAETGAQCSNALDDDGDGRINDGCPAQALPPITRAWVEDQTPGFSGIADIAAIVNNGANVAIGSATAQSPRVDYQLTFNSTGNWHVWVKMYAATANDDTLYAAVYTGAAGSVTPNVTMTVGTTNAWTWVDSGNINVPATGTRTVSLFMGKDGVRVDALWISKSGSPPNTLGSKGQTWSYATNATTYQATVCDGQDYDAAQDATIATGTATSCYANDALLTGGTLSDHAFDMSGNVKEWVLAEQSGHNPIRGGAANNTGPGIACALSFTLADDTFFFTNVGFRCCK